MKRKRTGQKTHDEKKNARRQVSFFFRDQKIFSKPTIHRSIRAIFRFFFEYIHRFLCVSFVCIRLIQLCVGKVTESDVGSPNFFILLLYFDHFLILFSFYFTGGLSVLLVVGDTWCAVTDPLRYHSRVSGLKSWILILTTWLISILFCIASALRSDCRLITTEITSTLQHAYFKASNREIPAETILSPSSNIDLTQSNVEIDKIYNLIYSCTFFVVIILMPICLVCAMYWKIFSEARQNGLRMRQNGSSPLLQSALNLAATAQVPVTADNCCSVIGEEDVDDDTASNSEQREHIQTISAMRRASVAGTSSHHVVINDSPISINRIHFNQHRNRYLEIPKFAQITQQKQHSIGSTNSSSTHGKTTQNGELRQVHSTPDLQKSICIELMASGDTKRQSNRNDVNSALPAQTSTIFTPPKALSYMTSIRHRLSNASSIFKYREESRAARISVLVVIMFLFSYFPYGLLVLLQGRVHFIANSSLLGVLFLLIANMTSPFIFAYRNRRVRRGVCRLFGVDAKTNERLQKQRILMRSSTIGSSCRDTSRKQKTKIVRIIRNSPKSASFSLGMKSTDIYTPIATQTTIIDEKIKSKVNECDKSVELDDRKSDSIINQKMISNQNVTMINGEKEMPYDVIINIGNSATPMTQSTFNCNSASVSASVIKQKILLFKRVCKLSNNSSDISCINRTPFECNVNTTKPVNV